MCSWGGGNMVTRQSAGGGGAGGRGGWFRNHSGLQTFTTLVPNGCNNFCVLQSHLVRISHESRRLFFQVTSLRTCSSRLAAVRQPRLGIATSRPCEMRFEMTQRTLGGCIMSGAKGGLHNARVAYIGDAMALLYAATYQRCSRVGLV